MGISSTMKNLEICNFGLLVAEIQKNHAGRLEATKLFQ
jgi:hypothetical protein